MDCMMIAITRNKNIKYALLKLFTVESASKRNCNVKNTWVLLNKKGKGTLGHGIAWYIEC